MKWHVQDVQKPVESVHVHAWRQGDVGASCAHLLLQRQVDAVLDRLADHMATHLDLDALGKIAGI